MMVMIGDAETLPASSLMVNNGQSNGDTENMSAILSEMGVGFAEEAMGNGMRFAVRSNRLR